MAVLKYKNPNYVEGGSEEKWIELPASGSTGVGYVTSTSVTRMEAVTELPESPDSNTLYLIVSEE